VDFALGAERAALVARVRAFVERELIPHEDAV